MPNSTWVHPIREAMNPMAAKDVDGFHQALSSPLNSISTNAPYETPECLPQDGVLVRLCRRQMNLNVIQRDLGVPFGMAQDIKASVRSSPAQPVDQVRAAFDPVIVLIQTEKDVLSCLLGQGCIM